MRKKILRGFGHISSNAVCRVIQCYAILLYSLFCTLLCILCALLIAVLGWYLISSRTKTGLIYEDLRPVLFMREFSQCAIYVVFYASCCKVACTKQKLIRTLLTISQSASLPAHLVVQAVVSRLPISPAHCQVINTTLTL